MQLPVLNSGLAQALSVHNFEFVLSGAVIGNNGVRLALSASQASADSKVFVALGGTVDATAAVMSQAVASAMVTPDNLQAVQYPMNPITDTSSLIVGLVNHMAQIEANADGADCVSFCVQGLPIKQVVSVELELNDVSILRKCVVAKEGGALVLPEPVTLGASSKIIKTGTTEIDFDTDTLNLLIKDQVVFGSLKLADVSEFVPAVGDSLVLRIKAII